MIRCPSCDSYNRTSSRFCGDCGARLRKVQGARTRRVCGWIVVVALLGLLGLVVYIAVDQAADSDGKSSVNSVATSDGSQLLDSSERRLLFREAVEETDRRQGVFTDPQSEASVDVGSQKVAAIVSRSLVVLTLQDSRERLLRELRGVLLDRSGVVLCRFSALFGAYRGEARLGAIGESGIEIREVIDFDELADLALLQLATENDTPAVELATGEEGYVAGDEIYVFSDNRPVSTRIEIENYVAADGQARIALEEGGGIPSDSFLAVDLYGAVIGLCRAELDRELIAAIAPRPRNGLRMLVDSAVGLDLSESSLGLTLQEVTQRYYEGSFADLLSRGAEACRVREWAEAIELLSAALDLEPPVEPSEEDVAKATTLLREAYLIEAERLARGQRTLDVIQLVEVGLLRFGDDANLWRYLGEARVMLREYGEGIDAFLEARALQPSVEIESRVEDTFLVMTRDALQNGDSRFAELSLVEGIEELPNSAKLHIELGRLYTDLTAWDDAIRVLQRAKELDRTLAMIADGLLARVDDALRRRDAVIIPIQPTSALRTGALIDDARYNFIIDTGATYTAIPSALAVELGYDLRRATKVVVRTAGGAISAPLIQVQSLSLEGYTVRNLRVLVLSSGLSEGLLGLNFLNHFKYSVDATRQEFRLERP